MDNQRSVIACFFTTIERVGFYKQASVGRLEWLFQQAVTFEDDSIAGFFLEWFACRCLRERRMESRCGRT